MIEINKVDFELLNESLTRGGDASILQKNEIENIRTAIENMLLLNDQVMTLRGVVIKCVNALEFYEKDDNYLSLSIAKDKGKIARDTIIEIEQDIKSK